MSDAGGDDATNVPPDPAPGGEGGLIDRLNTWQRLGVSAAGVITALVGLWNAVEQQWLLVAVTAVLALLAGALYVLSQRRKVTQQHIAAWMRIAAIALVVAVPLLSAIGLFSYSIAPRLHEQGTTVAILRFVGPPLPKPYDACRPSDALLTTLSAVGNRYGRLTAFELSASLDPDNRWAPVWAAAHGALEGADITVYGAYTLRNSKTNAPGADPDEIVIHSQVANVPSIPHTTTHAQLFTWDIPSSVESIADLCGGPTPVAGSPPPFLDSARRISLAIVGLQLFGLQDFQAAQQALVDARSHAKNDGRACDGTRETVCPGVLGFYLGTLDQRFGNYRQAEGEYRYAAGQLPTTAAYLDLGEMYMEDGRPNDAFVQFDNAVDADPRSVAALATRAYYERDYLRPWQSAIDLDRAIRARAGLWRNLTGDMFDNDERRSDAFDDIVLSRALYDRGDTACALQMLGGVINGAGFNRGSNVDALVRYGTWLVAAKRYGDAIQTLHEVVTRFDPEDPIANYELALALERDGGPAAEAAAYFRRAVFAPAHSDEEFLHQGDAANELRARYDDPAAAASDQQAALAAYARSIALNPKAAYAYRNRGTLYAAMGRDDEASADLRTAAQLHPFDEALVSEYAQYLDKHGLTAKGTLYHREAKYVADARIPPAEAAAWKKDACRYEGLDIGS